ncbi:MAG TPA: hypothetical protein VKS24_24965 [Bradyrhizobium sp.]|nr:hypothetical protein [Bradyrhizobium sp.]
MADPDIVPQADGGGTPVADVPAVVEPVEPAGAVPSLLSEAMTAAVPATPAVEPEPAAAAVDAPASPEPTPLPAAEPATPAAAAEPAAATPPATPPGPAPALEPIIYEPYQPPEGFTLDAERVAALDGKMASARVTNELRNELYSEHIAEMQRLDKHYRDEQWRVFNNQQRAEQEKVQADPELWRPGLQLPDQPALAAAVRMIDEFVPASQRDDWDQMMSDTGVGNRHIFIKFLTNLAKKFDAPATPLVPVAPPRDIGRAAGGGRRLRDLYDNPRSKVS